ncbi:MAG: aldo/keto reductase [Actinomycetota bacterium]
MSLPQRTLGNWKVSAMGLGCMPLSGLPTTKAYMLDDRAGAIKVIQTALDAGVTLLDTADIYATNWISFGHNERLVAEAFRTWSGSAEAKSKVVIATKGGITRGPKETWGRAATSDYLLRAAEASALRLGVDKIQLWQHHRLDPSIAFETQFENVLVLLERGLVERIGVSNYNPEQLRRAIKIGGTPAQGGLISVQNQYSVRYRNDAEIFSICEENGIAFFPWSPLGGVRRANELGGGEYSVFTSMAEKKGVSPYALAIAWHLHISPISIPIPGATKVESVTDSLVGLSISLSAAEVEELNSHLPESGPVDGELLNQPPFRD